VIAATARPLLAILIEGQVHPTLEVILTETPAHLREQTRKAASP
jgi:hypothetical protein